MNLVGNLETSTISLRNNSSTGAGGAGLIIAEGTATYAITGNTIADSGGLGLSDRPREPGERAGGEQHHHRRRGDRGRGAAQFG